MYIKIGNNIVNLDLVKEITDIVALVHDETKVRDKIFYTEIETKEEEERWLDISINGSEQQLKYEVVYSFSVEYLEGDSKRVVLSSKEKAEIARKKLSELLNNNQPIIHVIDLS